MTHVASIPKNAVTRREIDYGALVSRARQGPEEPNAQYEFGNGRKRFMSNLQGEGVYGKPVSVSGGVTTHLPDPDMVSTNP